jgi:hypothetical protein
MRLKCLGCEALARLLYFCAARSPHVIDIELFQIGLHKEPADLRTRLQGRIDATVDQGYDAVVMAYGLCGQATAGLTARDVPLVIPRAHDCITLFLGDRTRYSQEFLDHPGTYWYALDYCERSTGSISLGADSGEQAERTYDEYVQKYGQENADYLMEVMGAWQKHYDRAAFIDLGIGDSSAIEAKTQNDATRRGWTFERMAGDLVLIRRLFEGDWGEGFLRLEPGQQVTVSHDFDVVVCLPE